MKKAEHLRNSVAVRPLAEAAQSVAGTIALGRQATFGTRRPYNGLKCFVCFPTLVAPKAVAFQLPALLCPLSPQWQQLRK